MSGDGKGQVGHVGGVHLRLLAERTGLTGALSAALARPGFVPLHDRGQVMVDLAVAITLGATCIRDIRLLEHQVIARREPLHPRYVKDASAYEIKHEARYQTFATNHRRGQIAHLDGRTASTPGSSPRSAIRRLPGSACCPRAS